MSAASLNPGSARVDEDLLHRVEQRIRDAGSAESPISSHAIAHNLGIEDSDGQPVTRAAITELVRRGVPIGADSTGYFIIRTQEQLDRYVADLVRRETGIRARRIAVIRAFDEGRVPAGEPLRWIPTDPEER